MKKKYSVEFDTVYDVDYLISSSKKRLNKALLLLGLYLIVFVVSVFAVIFCRTLVPIFIAGIVVACICVFLCSRLIKNFAFSDYSSAQGAIVDVHKEIKIIDTMSVGGINPFGTRKFDNYKKNEVRLGIFIKNDDQIRSCFFNDGTEEHAKYYEAKGEVIHIWGTHFPVKLEIGKGKWLCPVCGEFNANEEKSCARCKKKILI